MWTNKNQFFRNCYFLNYGELSIVYIYFWIMLYDGELSILYITVLLEKLTMSIC